MSSSERIRPKPIRIKDKSEIRGNHSYIIEAPEPAPVKKEKAHGEAVSSR